MPAKRSQDDTSSTRSDFGSSSQGGRSAEEIRETVKEAVGKGVSAVAGVADGINETMEETNLDETAEQAIRQVGETTSKVVRAARETTDEIRSAVKGEPGSSSADSGIGLSSSYQEESSLGAGAATGSFASSTPVSEPFDLASQEEE
jgi:hypothetical protein